MQGARLIIRDFPYGTTEEQLRALIEPYAGIVAFEFPRHASGELKDFALVDVADEAQAQNAVHHLHGYVFEGRRLRVKIATPRRTEEGAAAQGAAREAEGATHH